MATTSGSSPRGLRRVVVVVGEIDVEGDPLTVVEEDSVSGGSNSGWNVVVDDGGGSVTDVDVGGTPVVGGVVPFVPRVDVVTGMIGDVVVDDG